MNSIHTDPNNHAPEVSPADEWCDAEAATGEAGIHLLPPRRTVAQQADSQRSQHQKTSLGLRIDAGKPRPEPSVTTGGLEVQEISGKVVRLDLAEPSPPKVARQITFHAKPVPEVVPANERGEGREWGGTNRKSMRWMIGAGAATVSIVVLVLLLLPVINAPNAVQADPNFKVVIEEKESRMEAVEQMNALLTRRSEAERILQAISSAGYVDDVVPFILKGTELKEILRKTWHSLADFRRWSPTGPGQWEVFQANERPYAQMAGSSPEHPGYATYFTTENGRLMLDWKATTAFGTATFEELEKGAGDASEIRGYISSTDYYNNAWPEDSYRSFRFVSPDQGSSIWCYARRGSEAEAIIAPLFTPGEIVQEAESERKVTLRLKPGRHESAANQWLIEEILHVDWVTP